MFFSGVFFLLGLSPTAATTSEVCQDNGGFVMKTKARVVSVQSSSNCEVDSCIFQVDGKTLLSVVFEVDEGKKINSLDCSLNIDFPPNVESNFNGRD